MATHTHDIDAVMAALRIVLREAEHTSGPVPVRVVNLWIGQLPGAWRGRWRRLKLRGDSFGRVPRDTLISHLRATLAYLEAQREVFAKQRRWWRSKAARKRPIARVGDVAQRIAASHPEPQAADEDEETQPRPKWLN